jgi:hypothetical protein
MCLTEEKLYEHELPSATRTFKAAYSLPHWFLCCAAARDFGLSLILAVQMMAGTVNPAAEGTINVSDSSNNNVKLDVKVQSLSNPSGLTPPENVYVLWVQPPGQPPQNQGEIKVDKTRKDKFTPKRRLSVSTSLLLQSKMHRSRPRRGRRFYPPTWLKLRGVRAKSGEPDDHAKWAATIRPTLANASCLSSDDALDPTK